MISWVAASSSEPDPQLSQPTTPAPHPKFAAPVRFQAIARPDDDERATADTIALMMALIRQDSADPAVRNAAAEAVAGIDAGDQVRQVDAIFWWIKRHVQLMSDAELARGIAGLASAPAETEVLIRPADLLAMPKPAGDCDDFSMLAAAMLRAVGIAAHLLTIAADPSEPGRYSHVFVVAHTKAGDVALDASHGPHPAWQARAAGKTRKWEIDAMNFARPLGDLPTWAQDIIKTANTAAWDIAKIKSTPSGYYRQSTPQGSVEFRQQPGEGGPFGFPSTQVGVSNATPLLILGGIAAVGVIAIFASRGRR